MTGQARDEEEDFQEARFTHQWMHKELFQLHYGRRALVVGRQDS